MNLILNVLFFILEKLGLKQALVSMDGTITMYRYSLTPWAFSDKNKLPAILIHHYPSGTFHDAEHHHPWDTLSLILRGGYTELIDGKEVRVNKRFHWTKLTTNNRHKITSVEKDSITMYCISRRKAEWVFIDNGEAKTFDRFSNYTGEDKRNRKAAMMKVDKNFYKDLEKKKKAWERLTRNKK